MAKTLTYDLTYDAPLSAVADMMMQEAFREQVCEAQGAIRKTICVTSAGSGTEVVVDQVQKTRGIPGYAKKIVGDEMNLVQTEHWSDAESATLDLDIPGKPGEITGTIQLSESGGTTTQAVEMTVRVSIPLVGGKVESLVVDLLARALRAENEVGRAYLAG